MKLFITLPAISLAAAMCVACNPKDERSFGDPENADIAVTVEAGPGWLHDYPVGAGISIVNAPQIAIWLEDSCGRYISTLYISSKCARNTWTASGGSTRPEALPVWSGQRGGDNIDGVTGATPRGTFTVYGRTPSAGTRLMVEVNHSADFDRYWPMTGGNVNGQPSIIYSAPLSPDSLNTGVNPEGHGSCDGSFHNIVAGTDSITSALTIVRSISVKKR